MWSMSAGSIAMGCRNIARAGSHLLTALSIRWFVEPHRTLGKDLAAGVGDADRMLELGRKRPVAGDGGPAVLQDLHVGAAEVDHRLDGENHSRHELGAGAGTTGMDHFGAVMEDATNAVTAEIANDAVTARFGVALDCVGDVAEMIAGFRLLKPQHQAFIGHVDQLAGAERHAADEIHAARIAVPAVENRSDVD